MNTIVRSLAFLSCVLLAISMAPAAFGQCDTMDGPVVAAAKEALDTADVTPALKWVKPESETELRAALENTLRVRKLGADAQALADSYFFETLVRLHRAGEGAPYTGLKPAGTPLEPGIAAAEQALAGASDDRLVLDLNEAVKKGVHDRFVRVLETKKHAGDSLEAGREYVAAYVDYIHYIERLHGTIAGGSGEDHAMPAAEHAHGEAAEHP